MTWFIVALGAPLIWSLVNHCDKIILSRYFKDGGSGGLMIFVGVVSIPIAIFIGFLEHSVFVISDVKATLLIISGILYNVTVFLYLKALEDEDASHVVPFWQLMPVFAYFLGIFVLGEYLSLSGIIGGIITITGAILLSIEFEGEGKVSFGFKVLGLMVLSSFVAALGDVLFKKSALDDLPFLVSMFWNQIGMIIFALALFVDNKFRGEFMYVFRKNSNKIIGLNIFEQIAEVVGIFINNYALLLAPVALVTLVSNTAQPIFVFIEGIILTLLFPKFVKEDISRGNLIKKFIAILIMGIGLYMITM